MKIHKALEDFLLHCETEKKLSSKTIKAYKTDLLQFNNFIVSQKIRSLSRIGKLEIKKYLQELSSFSPKTTKRKIASAKAFFNFHEFEENITSNPFRKIKASIKIPAQLPIVMTLQQVEQILTLAYQNKNNIKDKKKYSYKERLRDIAVLELLFATGIRVSELSNLTISDFDSDFSLIIVNGKGSKERIIPITNFAVKNALTEYFKMFETDINNYFFINRLKSRLSSQSVRLMVKRYGKDAKIQKNITPHIFRHSFATLLLEQDVDIRYIQNILGHSSINTTQIYTHVNNKKKNEILTLKHPRNELNVISE